MNQVEAIEHFKAIRGDLDRVAGRHDDARGRRPRRPRAPAHGRSCSACSSGRSGPWRNAFARRCWGHSCWKLLALEGVGPSLDQCARCGSQVELVAFDPGEGGFLCRSCRRGQAVGAETVEPRPAGPRRGLARALDRAAEPGDRRGRAPGHGRRPSTTSTAGSARPTGAPRWRRPGCGRMLRPRAGRRPTLPKPAAGLAPVSTKAGAGTRSPASNLPPWRPPLNKPPRPSRAVRRRRQSVQAAGFRVPLGRDLRRHPLHLRLRAARGPHAAQRPRGLVAGDDPRARRRRADRRRHPHQPEGLGGVRPPRDLHRPPRRLPQLQGALAGGPDRGRLPELRLQGPDRGPARST